MTTRQNLLAQLQHANLKNGEFVFRFDDQWIQGHMTNLKSEWSVHTQAIQVEIEGIVPLDKLA